MGTRTTTPLESWERGRADISRRDHIRGSIRVRADSV